MAQDFDNLLAALTGMNGGLPTVDASQLQSVQPQIQQSNTPTAPNNDMGKIRQILNELRNKQQDNTSSNGSVLSILSQRFKPTMQDAADTGLNNTLSLLVPGSYKPTTMEEQTQKRVSNELAPYTTMMGLQEKQAETELKQAHTKSYGQMGGGGVLGAQVQMLMQDNPRMTFTQAFQLAQTGMRQGVQYDASGRIVPIAGMAEAKGKLKEGEISGKERAETNFAAPKASETAKGKELGESSAHLADLQAYQPGLEKTIQELHDLGQDATYTLAGQGRDILVRQMGGTTKGAIARKEYINKVNDQLLPLLRQTFGAQFTLQEGENLKATLGDPDSSPLEKDAALRAFITQKQRSIDALKIRTGQSSPSNIPQINNEDPKLNGGATHRFNPATEQLEEIQ